MTWLSGTLTTIVFSYLLFLPALAYASCMDQLRLTGVSLAGAEFNSNKLPGVINKDYVYPTDAELTYIAAQGANIIRLPFRWERVQPEALGELNADEVKRLQNTVASASAKGLCVLLDIHNYAKYFGEPLGDNVELQNAFVNLWLRLATVFGDTGTTAFGLMNEPRYMPIAQWATLSKRTLAALRAAQSTNLVFIAGGNWSGVHDWFVERDGVSNASAFADLKDPLKRTIIEVHQYADANFSGTNPDCVTPETLTPRFERLTNWASENGHQLFLGEFGLSTRESCLLILQQFMKLMDGPHWKGWAYWAAGRWWNNYAFVLNTGTATPVPQWGILKNHFYVAAVDPTLNPPVPPGPSERRK